MRYCDTHLIISKYYTKFGRVSLNIVFQQMMCNNFIPCIHDRHDKNWARELHLAKLTDMYCVIC